MPRLVIIALALTLTAALCSCQSSDPFLATEADKLTVSEKSTLTKHARHFLKSQQKKLLIKSDELHTILTTRPKIRAHYTGHKEGRASIGWDLPRKQVFAIVEGNLMSSRDWHISIAKKSNVIYFKKKKKSKTIPKISRKEFNKLRQM